MPELERIPKVKREGSERFHSSGKDIGFDLLGFWRWSASDVVSNATRGRLAEYIIAKAIGAANDVRDEWAAYDLLDPRGISIEVKSAAYIQSWHQNRFSTISFNYPKTHAWDSGTNRQSGTATGSRLAPQQLTPRGAPQLDQNRIDFKDFFPSH